MKKFTAMLLSLLLLTAFVFTGCTTQEANIWGEMHFEADGVPVVQEMTMREIRTFMNMFGGKELSTEDPGCEFSEKLCLKFENITFLIGQDGSGIVKVQETGKYLSLTHNELLVLTGTLLGHGAQLPYSMDIPGETTETTKNA